LFRVSEVKDVPTVSFTPEVWPPAIHWHNPTPHLTCLWKAWLWTKYLTKALQSNLM
jgi:hypothetical protein